MIIALTLAAALGGMLVILLTSASADTALFARHTPLLIILNALAALLLLGLVITQLRRLWRDYRNGVFGARLKTRLLMMLAMMAVLPGALVYAVSMQFAVKSIDSWFDVRIEAALDGGLDLARSVFETMQTELLVKGRSMAYDLAEVPAPGAVLLNRLREQAGVNAAVLVTANGQLVASSSASELPELMPALPDPVELRQARTGTGSARVEGDAASGFVVRALLPVRAYRFAAEPLILQLEQPVPAAIAQSAALVEAAQRDYQQLQLGRAGLKRLYTLTLTFALLLALFAAIALAFFLASRLAKPLLMLAEGTRAVAAGDLTPRAVLETDDELGVLTRSFNEMTQQLSQARVEREAAQRAAVWGEVARRLAHEIKNPLTPIQLSAERLQMKLSGKLAPEDAAMLERATKTIVDQVEAMKAMVNDFRDYARLPPPNPQPLDLNRLIAEVLELYAHSGFNIETELDPLLPPVLADADQIRQVLHNLIKNAAEACGDKVGAGGNGNVPPGADPSRKVSASGTARILVKTRHAGRKAELVVADNGPGFPPEILQHAFEPYVTTKPKGTGLGLAIVHKIVVDHGGTVTLANRPAAEGGGARVCVQLPIAPSGENADAL
ncbi:sensor histidine kinase [Sulfuricystis thermophila]|uniref:sensor histidine kinase n=1 Tax=Sulfuricystis thermophila TaxID=2496847 RepID=UPI0010365EE1|nr:ATP-binding protein [Sulfuricystis thermophila]